MIIETSTGGLGMRVDETLYVIDITKQGPCDGKLLPGDHIIQVHFTFVLKFQKIEKIVGSIFLKFIY